MDKNEKAIAGHDGSNNYLTEKLTMRNSNTNQNIFQLNSNLERKTFVLPELPFEKPTKILEIIHCCDCRQQRELDGYRFKLMPVCSDCRTERSLEILSNQIERRVK
jgi:hypothetical protein